MRMIFMFLLCYSSHVFAQNNIYDIEMNAIDSKTIFLKNYAGNKILFVMTSLASLEKGDLKTLDSIQDKYPSVMVMVIPSQQTITQKDIEIAQSLKNEARKRAVFFEPAIAAKDQSSERNPLIKYLTSAKENGHFDVEIKTDFIMFLVSESGSLSAVMERMPNAKQFDALLTQNDITR